MQNFGKYFAPRFLLLNRWSRNLAQHKSPISLEMKKIFLATATLATLLSSSLAKADNVNKYKQSFSIQFGINGYNSNQQSYGFAVVPPDFAYSHELFDNDLLNISTATFYDNIGVNVKGREFTYRVGQRLDFGLELGKYTPYVTLGFGTMRGGHNFQTSAVYGSGFLTRISERWLWVNEINFQNIHSQNSSYVIANISTGLTYGF